MKPLLQEGDIIELTSDHKVYASIPKHFAYANCKGDFSITRAEAYLGGEQYAYLRGKYVVVRTTFDGGGPSHDGGWPDGHHVFCESLNGKQCVDFYQTGCFTAMITDIQVIERATVKQWSYVSMPGNIAIEGYIKELLEFIKSSEDDDASILVLLLIKKLHTDLQAAKDGSL